MAVHQVVATASPRDAVTNSAFAFRELLRQAGPSEVYALHIDPQLEGEVLPIDAFAASDPSPGDLVLYHLSIGAPRVVEILSQVESRLAVVYHNISPPEAFAPYDRAFAGLLEIGRRELRELAGRAVLAITPSRFNAQELTEAGYRDVRVVPLIVERPATPPPTGTAAVDTARFDLDVDGPVAVFIGQLLPHKRPEFLLHAFHALTTHLRPDVHLWLVGAARLPAYAEALHDTVAALSMPNVRFISDVADAALQAILRRADLFVTASDHEGFCVPIVEAFAATTPVVARRRGAVPETVGDAGVLLDPGDGPLVLAEAVAEVLANDPLRQTLIDRGTARLEWFDPARSASLFIRSVIDAMPS